MPIKTKDNKTLSGRSFKSRRSAGMTLIEVLLALIITAMMLAAIAVAFDAALMNYQANQEMGMATVSLRNVVTNMTHALRSAWNDPDVNAIAVSGGGSQCSFVDADGRSVCYLYDSTSSELQLEYDNSGTWHTLLTDVAPVATGQPVFQAVPANSDYPTGTVACVEIRFKINSDQGCYPVSFAAVPRNMLFH